MGKEKHSRRITPLHSLWLLLIPFLFTGCGFHLKGYRQASPALNGLFIMGSDERESLAGVLREILRSGGVALVSDAASARYRLQITEERFHSRVLSVDANGKALDNEMRLEAAFRLYQAQAGETPPAQRLELVRQLSYSGDDELGQRNEAALMVQDMRNDMAGQIIRRLEAWLK
ncbi:MAG: hypothetical protein KZQ88_00690 [Candidatus Thiodiazotropha sp. (ex Dulcina madagascariensis)]|nr:hypothetical protein [Candidatus Thiodiazotropha sp. (ex Epidulcina cf. delphinae)]MCU7921200.1 hypothetical protein [Candidatus Thiodiazotropha sp. (ex Dulcina madagascariensis)]MCU7925751.1 hypothetical protein [Candidatus Thiodiazotropha sp. (ex Dulcina madagascariensis)]